MNYQIRNIKKSDIELIKPLWEKLNRMHLEDSRYFKDHFRNFTFEKRKEKFNEMDDKNMLIDTVFFDEKPVGYCISSIANQCGEIESLFIEEEHRKSGSGRNLVENAVKWMKSNNCRKIGVSVAEGHESVFGFYRKFGFYPRMTYLELKEEEIQEKGKKGKKE
jgi:diamine N-acetyltransferase